MSSFTRQQLEDYLQTIEVKGGRVLDVGGSQNPLSKSRLKVFKPDEYKILDLEEPHVCKQKPDFICDIQDSLIVMYDHTDLDIDESGTGSAEYAELREPYVLRKFGDNFDTIFCLEVSEYWINPLQALRNINYMLKQDGLFYSSWHFLYSIHNPKEEDCLRYTPRGVEKLLKETGFEILGMKPRLIKNNAMWRDFYTLEGMRPAKNCDKQGWAGCIVKCKKL